MPARYENLTMVRPRTERGRNPTGDLNGHNVHVYPNQMGDRTLVLRSAHGIEPPAVLRAKDVQNRFLVFAELGKDFDVALPDGAQTIFVLPARQTIETEKERKQRSLVIAGGGNAAIKDGVITHLHLRDHTRLEPFDATGVPVPDASPADYFNSITTGEDNYFGEKPLPMNRNILSAASLFIRREDFKRDLKDPTAVRRDVVEAYRTLGILLPDEADIIFGMYLNLVTIDRTEKVGKGNKIEINDRFLQQLQSLDSVADVQLIEDILVLRESLREQRHTLINWDKFVRIVEENQVLGERILEAIQRRIDAKAAILSKDVSQLSRRINTIAAGEPVSSAFSGQSRVVVTPVPAIPFLLDVDSHQEERQGYRPWWWHHVEPHWTKLTEVVKRQFFDADSDQEEKRQGYRPWWWARYVEPRLEQRRERIKETEREEASDEEIAASRGDFPPQLQYGDIPPLR